MSIHCAVFCIYLFWSCGLCISHSKDRLRTFRGGGEQYMKQVRLHTLCLQNLPNEISCFLIQHFISNYWYFYRVSNCSSVQLNWESDRFPCPATGPISSFWLRFNGVCECCHTLHLAAMGFPPFVSVRQRCCCSWASGWSESCWPVPARWWTPSLSVWWTEPRSPTLLE